MRTRGFAPSVLPAMKDDRSVAEVALVDGTEWKTVTKKPG